MKLFYIFKKIKLKKWKSPLFTRLLEFVQNRELYCTIDNPTYSLAQIALQNGFYDQAHFTKVFKEMIGTTPASFIQMMDIQFLKSWIGTKIGGSAYQYATICGGNNASAPGEDRRWSDWGGVLHPHSLRLYHFAIDKAIQGSIKSLIASMTVLEVSARQRRRIFPLPLKE